METYEIIKKFLTEGGKCILIENNKPIGVVLTIEEYELLKGKSQISNPKSQNEEIKSDTTNSKPTANPIGEAMVKEINSPSVSADISDIAAADDVTLEDLGIDELPY